MALKIFFGMSVEPAKICILFEDKTSKSSVTKQQPRHDSYAQQQPQHTAGHQQPRKESIPQSEPRRQSVQQPQQQQRQQPSAAPANPLDKKRNFLSVQPNRCRPK